MTEIVHVIPNAVTGVPVIPNAAAGGGGITSRVKSLYPLFLMTKQIKTRQVPLTPQGFLHGLSRGGDAGKEEGK